MCKMLAQYFFIIFFIHFIKLTPPVFTNVPTVFVRNGWKKCVCVCGCVSSAVYAPEWLSVCLSGGTLGCCKSAHTLFIRLNLGTLLLLASELVNSDGAVGLGAGVADQLRVEVQHIKSAILWSARHTVSAGASALFFLDAHT